MSGLISQVVSHMSGLISQVVSHTSGLISQVVSHTSGLLKKAPLCNVSSRPGYSLTQLLPDSFSSYIDMCENNQIIVVVKLGRNFLIAILIMI